MNAKRVSAPGKRLHTFLTVIALTVALVAAVLTVRVILAASGAQAVSVEVRSREGSPLAIGSITVATSDPRQPVFGYEVTNSGSKPISAYVIRYDVTVGGFQTSGAALTTLSSLNSVLYPHGRSSEDFRGVTYGAEVSKVVLSVDFVEFIDGSTWGEDSFKMSEKLAGNRAGGQAALSQFRGKLKARGLAAVLEAIEGETVAVPQAGKSQLWNDSFKEGVNIVRARLQNAKRKGGPQAVERELLRPFHAAEGRQ